MTPKRVGDGLEFIAREAKNAGRKFEHFGTALHLFVTLGPSYEAALESQQPSEQRYAMDFREPAKRYAAVGKPAESPRESTSSSKREFATSTSISFCVGRPRRAARTVRQGSDPAAAPISRRYRQVSLF